jgi:hypothetical protein
MAVILIVNQQGVQEKQIVHNSGKTLQGRKENVREIENTVPG